MARRIAGSLKWEHTATISGRCRFPFDMLRYDSCFPTTEQDAQNIAWTYSDAPVAAASWAIRVTRHTESKRDQWTVDRWRSFGVLCTPEDS